MTDVSTYEQLLKASGVSLEDLGLREVGLRRSDAVRAVEQLKASGVPILGGDVYLLLGERVEQAFANWHIDRQPSEALAAFAERSCEQTRKYIDGFPEDAEVSPVFVLVVAAGEE